MEIDLFKLLVEEKFDDLERILPFFLSSAPPESTARVQSALHTMLLLKSTSYLRNISGQLEKAGLALESRQTPLERFESLSRQTYGGHFHAHYPEWRMRRQWKIMQLLGPSLPKARILELGCGIGALGSLFAEMGARVVALEGRAENVLYAKRKYSHLPNYDIQHRNILDDFSDLGPFDVILNLGLLEVLKSGAEMTRLLALCAPLSADIIIDTVVCDSLESEVQFRELSVTCDGPIASEGEAAPTEGAIPSPKFVEDGMAELGFAGEAQNDPQLNSSNFHRYDWRHNDPLPVDSRRRFWRFRRT
jgi:2-polyprenyl-3-methyl-5-hydroxy-6-metoxy-1,4-benzoquinol methylase